jgi:hypothetical protein
MRRKISTRLMISAVILSALLIPTVFAKKHTLVDGTWSWGVDNWMERPANGNMHISATELDVFSGTFEGTGIGPFKMTWHSNDVITGSGKTVFTGSVDGKSGTCVIMWVGKTINEEFWWSFKWIIISGTGELSNLRGKGTCYGPGPPGVEMTGWIHFDPS